MRVLHVGKYAPSYPGGIESYLGHLLTALNADGVRAHALVHAHPGQHTSSPNYTIVPTLGRLMFTPLSPAFPKALNQAIDRFAPTLLHVHMPNVSAFSALWSASARALPWILHWHADVAGNGGRALKAGYLFYRYFERRMLAQSAAIIATSPAYLEASETLRPWRQKVHLIPLGCRPGKPSAEDCSVVESLWPRGLSRVLFVGRASYYKGLGCLLEAIVQATSAGLIVIGPGTAAALRTDVGRRNLRDRTLLLDKQPANIVTASMATADCLCLPSTGREEAFGMAAIEAMAQGLPILATEITGSGLPWVVESGVTGELVPVRDVGALALAIDRISKDPSAWARMGQAALNRFQRHFDIRSSVSTMRKLYETALASPAAVGELRR